MKSFKHYLYIHLKKGNTFPGNRSLFVFLPSLTKKCSNLNSNYNFSLSLILSFSLLLLLVLEVKSENGTLRGVVTDEKGEPMELVSISVANTTLGTTTNTRGEFTIFLPSGLDHEILISFLGYETVKREINLDAGETQRIIISMNPLATNLPDFEIREEQITPGGYTRIDPNLSAIIPGPGSSVESLVKTMPGVNSSNELSSQYSVRGGNYDENLLYVNGIEVYRPFLVRSGQQEGLSFLNSDLVSNITFSAGGFDAEYGDKMASVLDIQYKSPDSLAGSFTMSLLEGSFHIEDSRINNRLKYLLGLRHKSNQYLLGTLDTQGDYNPRFTDLQTFIGYRFSPEWELNFLGNISRNRYLFVPDVQSTRFGTVTEVRQFTVFFDGQESNRFLTTLGALSLNYTPNPQQRFQLITSVFQTDETENFDIRGEYLLERVETDLGSNEFGQPTGTPLGVGTFHNNARNYLNAIVYNIEHKAQLRSEGNVFKYGLKFQYEDIYDRLKEWSLSDSSGFSIPINPDPDLLTLEDTLRGRIMIQSQRISGYIQNSHDFDLPQGRFTLTAGIRSQYWSFNNQLIFSPRATMLLRPGWAPRMTFRLSGGWYHQPAFYRELRDMEGNINTNNRAQESVQVVLGTEYDLQIWDRPFKYTAEVYYKHFDNLIPYELDNVRIRYYANNISTGYATGLDMKINGEFVPGIESWASLSLMQTKEKIEGATFTDSLGNEIPLGYIPRPTDQLFSFSLFFQDFLPRNPSYKVNLALVYGTGLPVSPPTDEKSRSIFNMRPYRRVDIGFSKQLIGSDTRFSRFQFLNGVESMWISAEIFNLLEIDNTISYLWIKDIQNELWAIPNYLTSRLINVKLVTRF